LRAPNNKIEILWEGPDISSKDYLEGFDGKIYFGDLDGNGIQEIILIGWRFRADEETRGYPYKGNIYVYGWNGKTFKQIAMTEEFETYGKRFKIADVLGNGSNELVINAKKKLYVIQLKGKELQTKPILDTNAGVGFAVSDFDDDGNNEIIFQKIGQTREEDFVTIVKYDSEKQIFTSIYKKKFLLKQNGYRYINIGDFYNDPVGTAEVVDPRETREGYSVVPLEYDGKRHYFRFIPKTKRYPGEKPEEWDNKLKEIEVKDPVFKEKEEPAKYPDLALPQGTHHFADLDGDGADELINCGPKGVSIYPIK